MTYRTNIFFLDNIFRKISVTFQQVLVIIPKRFSNVDKYPIKRVENNKHKRKEHAGSSENILIIYILGIFNSNSLINPV